MSWKNKLKYNVEGLAMESSNSLKVIMGMVDIGSALHSLRLKLVYLVARSRDNNDTEGSSLSIGSNVHLVSPSMGGALPNEEMGEGA